MPSQDTYNSALTDADQDVMACQTSLICEENLLTCFFLFFFFDLSTGVTRSG